MYICTGTTAHQDKSHANTYLAHYRGLNLNKFIVAMAIGMYNQDT